MDLVFVVMAKKPVYAVFRGRKTGVFNSWPDCHEQVDGFKVLLTRNLIRWMKHMKLSVQFSVKNFQIILLVPQKFFALNP